MAKLLTDLPDLFTVLQGITAIIVLGVWAALLLMGREVPQEVTTLVGLVVGFFFGGVSGNLFAKLRGVK